MKITNRYLAIGWGVMYGLCALLSLIPEPNSLVKALLLLVGLAFYVPGAILLYRSFRHNDLLLRKRIRLVCAVWLVVTAVLLMLNISSTGLSENMGNLLHYTLVILGSPMGCIQNWMLGVFLWACLLYASFLKRKPQ